LFRAALLPLVNADVLSAVLFQFPQSFRYTPDNRIYLDKLLSAFSSYPSVVEFRHREWFHTSVFTGLEKRNAGLCICDMPHLNVLPEFVPVVTGSAGYIRFHGHNTQNWYNTEKENVSSRYDYLYSEKELQDIIPSVKRVASGATIVHVFFNNHPNGSAAVNAAKMQELLS